MRLTSIRLVGFKSFVDPVNVPFDGNMTAVVGPNGCGKSNIIDAVRWVMGESSARTLRGESMADVIFNGSTRRKPVGQASIELKFDNRDGEMGGMYAQYAEIAVKRQVTRDGQSTYFFNGQKCRRRDIADLFMGTGLGPRSYAIIGQGMITRLIEARPDDLRATLEEAAGISKYKERRRETENRMRRTQENLDRLDDIREELDKQLERLKRQAEAARRYQTLKHQEHRLKGELALLRGRAMRAEQHHQETRVAELETAVEKDVFGVRHCETRLEQAREQHDALADVLDRHQQAFYATTTRIARIEQDQSHRKSRQAQLASDMDAARRERDEQRQVSEGDSERLAAIDERLEALLPDLEALDEQLDTLAAELEDADPQREAAEEAWTDADDRWRSASREAERGQDQLRDLEQRIQRLREERERRHAQRGDVDDVARLRAEHAEQQEVLSNAEADAEQLAEQREATQQQLSDARETLQTQSRHRDQAQATLSRIEGEQASLQALIDAALADHDPALDAALAERGLAQTPRLGEAIDVAPGWETVVSWLLDPWLSARLVDTKSLTALPEALAADWCLVDSTEAPAATGTLAEKVKGAGALGHWLGRIRRVDTAAEALERVATLAPGESVLSRDGVWQASGFVRQQASGEGIDALLVTRRRHAELEEERGIRDDQLAEAERQREAAGESLEACEDSLESLSRREREHAATLQQAALAERGQAQRIEHLESRAAELDEELARLDASDADLTLELEEQRERWGDAMARLEQVSLEREDARARRQQQQEHHEQLTQQQAPLRARQQELTLERERLHTERNSLNAQRERSDESEERLALRIAEIEESLEALQEPDELAADELDELLEQREQQESRLNDARSEAQALAEQLRVDEQNRQEHERTLGHSREQLQQRRMEVQALSLKADAQQEQLAELELDADTLAEGLADDADETRWQATLDSTTDRIRRLGAINLAAIEEYEQQAERRNYLEAQHEELIEALDTLERAIQRIDQETRSRFKATFDQVDAGLQGLFPRVFGGGTAWLTLTGEDLLETGVAIMARPPGKKNSTIHLLSGGEKALTALSLVFAIFQLNPAPFCMLDEVDAPLDDANVSRYARLVKEMSESVQFIYITHNKIAMESAERLMGVTMQEPGVSRLVAVGVEEAAALADEA